MSQFIGTSMPRGSAGDITRGMFDYTTEVNRTTQQLRSPTTAFWFL